MMKILFSSVVLPILTLNGLITKALLNAPPCNDQWDCLPPYEYYCVTGLCYKRSEAFTVRLYNCLKDNDCPNVSMKCYQRLCHYRRILEVIPITIKTINQIQKMEWLPNV